MKDLHPNIILNKLRNGDDSPIFDLYKLYRNEFIVWAVSTYKAREEQAQDAFQEAVLDFHQNVVSGQLTELSSTIKTYLFQIGKHKLLNIQKKESRMTYHEALHLIENGEMESFMDEYNNSRIQKFPTIYYKNVMEKKNFEKLHEYKRKHLYDLFAKAKECADEIDLEHNLDEVNEKLLKELRDALRNMVTFS